MKVLTVFGTRPEAIKMAPVVRGLSHCPERCEVKVCVTAQHREMLDQILELFSIVPDYDLNVMTRNQSPGGVAAAVLVGLEPVLRAEQPDWVLVQGDTTTAAAAALGSFYQRVRVGHVEAGLRTSDKWQPFPEEINRRVAGVVADIHFAPTDSARRNLLREGVDPEAVVTTGNTVIDALRWVEQLPYDPEGGPLREVPWDRRVILVTAHRRENLGPPLEDICQAVIEIVEAYPNEVHAVFPVHLNPNVQTVVQELLGGRSGITLTSPLDYLPMVYALKRCSFVLTDSGGLQEEAPALGKPVLVLRGVTERPEAVEAGTARLVGTRKADIVRHARQLLDDRPTYEAMARAVNPFGDGRAADRMVRRLLGR